MFAAVLLVAKAPSFDVKSNQTRQAKPIQPYQTMVPLTIIN